MRTICCVLVCTLVIYASSRAQNNLLDSTINAAYIQQVLGYLASDSLNGRLTGTRENIRAAEFIAQEFANAGLLPLASLQGYYMQFQTKVNSQMQTSYNVVAALPGKSKPQEIVIICAHYDHIGTSSTIPHPPLQGRLNGGNTDNIYNGANDNASGVTAMLALARYYTRLNNNERTLLFIAFSGEELGLIGSYAFARTIKSADDIKAVLNIEMIGKTSSGIAARPYITGSAYSNLRKILNDELNSTGLKSYNKNYFRTDLSVDASFFWRSDNYPFAELGIPAHTIMLGSDSDPRYHSVEDELESLNINMMTEIVRGIALAAAPLVNGTQTPRRISARSITGKRPKKNS